MRVPSIVLPCALSKSGMRNRARCSRSSWDGDRDFPTPEFSVHRERVHFRNPQQLETDPELVLRAFEFVARHGIRLSNEAIAQLEARLLRLREYFDESRPFVAGVEPDSLPNTRTHRAPFDA
ncbi:MAG: hypothetical protein WDO73_32105 [Ignavibacteriota bacterium]